MSDLYNDFFLRNRRKEAKIQDWVESTKDKARSRIISNLQKQDSILARRIKSRVESAWYKASAGSHIDHFEYLSLMRDLKYVAQNDESLEADCEALWNLMLQSERLGVLCAPDHVLD